MTAGGATNTGMPAKAELRAPRMRRRCPICDYSAASQLYRNNFVPIDGIDLSYVVRECERCGAAYADEIAPPAELARYYATCSKYDVATALSDVAQVDRRRARTAAELVVASAGAVRSVLDLGCGVGTLLDAFRSVGASRLVGFDPAPNSPEGAALLYGLHGVQVGSWADAASRLGLNEFDAICLTGVLEHLADVGQVLSTIRSSMRAGAVLLVEVPAVERFTDEPCEPFGEFSLEHLNYFCASGLRRLAARTGFAVQTAQIIATGPSVTPSIFAVLLADGCGEVSPQRAHPLGQYVAISAAEFRRSLERFHDASRSGPLIIYGAGSHTARLLAALDGSRTLASVAAIVDGNRNLQGRQIGQWTIEPPDFVQSRPGMPIVVSSFRSQSPIAGWLRSNAPNPVLTLYDLAAEKAGDYA